MEEEAGVIRQLLELKKELKCWEAMFERKHGRKPNKDDVEQSPSEIKDTYRQYQRLKAGEKKAVISRNTETNCNGGSMAHTTSEAASIGSEDVFGCHLNKKKAVKETRCDGEGKERERKGPMWKLRKWTKEGGYKTVVGEAASSNIQNDQANNLSMSEEKDAEKLKDSSTPKTAEESIDVNVELKKLSLKINMKISQSPQKKPQSMEEVPLVRHRWPGAGGARPRMGHSLSSQWLQRCKPDLSSLPRDEDLREREDDRDLCEGGQSEDKQVDDCDKDTDALEHLDSDSAEEGVVDEGDLMEEEEVEVESEEEREVVTSTEEEESDEGECGGWDGRLQHVAHQKLFDPATKHGDATPLANSSTSKSSDNPLSQSSLASATPAMTSKPVTDTTKSKPARAGVSKPLPGPQSCGLSSAASGSGLGLLEGRESFVSVAASVRPQPRNSNWTLLETSSGTGPTNPGKETAPNTRTAGNWSTKSSNLDSTFKPSKPKRKAVSEKAQSSDIGGSSSSSAPPVFTSNAVSENFVRLNLKVKRFSCKTGGSVGGSAYKRKMWKKSQRGRGGGGGGGGGGRGGGGGGSNNCFKCGKPGHWANNCTERAGSKNLGCFAGEKVQFSEAVEEEMDRETLQRLAEESPFPSTREAAMMARGVTLAKSREGDSRRDSGGDGGTEAESFLPLPPCRVRSPSPPAPMEPLFSTDHSSGESLSEVESEMKVALRKLGYQSFRPGQAEAISRILSGVSTLLVQPTGSGKSLCYQLPAFLYSQRSSCLTLVISPLVSLMEDQVRQFPACLKGACLHTNQTQSQRQRIMADVAEGRVEVLLLSPEALVSGAFWSGWTRHTASKLPQVAFACIDEAHCVSEWSHNFRPSYLRVHKVLRERLGVQCVLGLTATATRTTALSVASHLSVAAENIIRGSTIPSNLHITASCDDNRDDALLQLLQSSRMAACDSIIIYCTRQKETERVAQLLRTSLQYLPAHNRQQTERDGEDAASDNDATTEDSEPTTGRRKRARAKSKASQGKRPKKAKLECSVESYHAGMSAAERRRIQLAFMTGRLRMVVATVAFGMGLNKSDVRAIIHYNVPKSFESYVQEIGRAGRDGRPAYCHVFIDQQGSDLCELRRHAYSSTVDPYSVKRLVKKVFPSCHCKPVSNSDGDSEIGGGGGGPPKPLCDPGRWCPGHEVSIPIESTVQTLDVKEECVQTLLCYLELQGWLEMKGTRKDCCTLKCYGGPRQLRALAQKVPAVAAASARIQESGTCLDMQSSISFSCVEVASSMGWESHVLRSELRDLQFNDRGTSRGSNSSSSVLVEFSDPSLHLLSPGDLDPGELDHVRDHLQGRVKAQETLEVEKLHLLYSVLRSVTFDDIYEYFADDEKTSSAQGRLMGLVNDYFEDRLDCTTAAERGIHVLKLPSEVPAELEAEISRDVHSLMSIHAERSFSGRTIARIFHGIASPCFPAEVWARQQRFWRRHLSVDFNTLCRIATKVTLQILHS